MLIIIFLFQILSVSASDSFVNVPQKDSSIKNYDAILSLDNDNKLKSLDNDKNFKLELLKIWVPAVIALIVLLFTNLFTLWKIRKESSESLKKELILSKIRLEKDKLKNLYDPIYTILQINSEIFNSFGPNSFPDDDDLRRESAIIWNKMVENIIIPNNRRIGEIIIHYSHLIHSDDKFSDYLEYLKHLESYEHFIKFPNSIHKAHKYPKNFISNVSTYRNKILTELKDVEKKLVS